MFIARSSDKNEKTKKINKLRQIIQEMFNNNNTNILYWILFRMYYINDNKLLHIFNILLETNNNSFWESNITQRTWNIFSITICICTYLWLWGFNLYILKIINLIMHLSFKLIHIHY